MRTRNLIKNSELMTSDQIISNDQVRSDQRSDRTGNLTDFGTRNSNKNFDQSRPKRTKTCQSRPQPTEADQGRPKPTTADESWRKQNFEHIWEATFCSNFDEFWSHMDRNSDWISTYFDHTWIKIRIKRGAIWNKIWIDISIEIWATWSNLKQFRSPGHQKSIRNRSRDPPEAPQGAQGVLGDDLERPRRAPGVPRERPGSVRWAPSEAIWRDRNWNKSRNQNLDRTLSKLDHKWYEFWTDYWANLIDFWIVSWSKSGLQKSIEIRNFSPSF